MTVPMTPQVNKPLTVSQLLNWCQDAVREGHGERYVLMASDEEQNSFHPAWSGFGLPCDDDMELIDSPRSYDIDKVIILS